MTRNIWNISKFRGFKISITYCLSLPLELKLQEVRFVLSMLFCFHSHTLSGLNKANIVGIK